jgi:hypothetical protein
VFPPALSKIICNRLAAERFRVRGAKVGGGNRTRDCRTAVPRAIHLVNPHPDLDSACCILSQLKKPTQKTHPKKPKKTHLKNPTKNVFFWVFLGFLNFLFFMKIIQTFLFQTDFL